MYAQFARIVVLSSCLVLGAGNATLAVDYPTGSFASPIEPAVQPATNQPASNPPLPATDQFGSGSADISPAAFQSPEVFQRPDRSADPSPAASSSDDLTPAAQEPLSNSTRPVPSRNTEPENILRQPHQDSEEHNHLYSQPAHASSAPARLGPGEIDARPLEKAMPQDKPVDRYPVKPASRSALDEAPPAEFKRDAVAKPVGAAPRSLPLTSDSGKTPDSKAKLAPKPNAAKSGMNSLTTVLGSLGIAIGLFLVLAWVMRRSGPKANRTLSSDVVEVLGRSPLVGRQQMQLIRFGNKLVLVSVSPGNVDTISEITDPVEIDRIAGICQQGSPFSATSSFRQALSGYGGRSGKHESSSETAPAQNFSSLFRRPTARSSEAYDA